MSVLKKTDRKLEEAVEAARAELARRRDALSKAVESRTLAAAAAGGGGWTEKRGMRRAEEAVERLEDEVAEAEAQLRERESEVEQFMAANEEAGDAASGRWMKAARKRGAEIGRLLAAKQKEVEALGREGAALCIEAERRAPRKLVARRCLRLVRVEVLDEGLKKYYGEEMSMEFFKARRSQEEGKVKIIPDQNLTLAPEDIEYERQDIPLPRELEALRSINIGRIFPSDDAREEISFNAIAATLTEEEIQKAAAAVGEV
jgi:hypothetical protein